MNFSLAGSRGLKQGPVCATGSPETTDRGLPIRFCQTPLRPWWLQIDFPATTTSAIPAEATAHLFAPACWQKAAEANDSPPAKANDTGHASPAVRRSSPSVAVNSATTSSESASPVFRQESRGPFPSEGGRINLKRLISGGQLSRMGIPRYPMPRLTYREQPPSL